MSSSIKKIRLLTNALLKNSMAEADPFKFKGLKIAIYIIGTAIMVGCAVLVGYFTQILTVAVTLLGGGGTEAAQLIMYFISVFGAVFGVNVICGLFYFSMDLSRILPYPFRPAEICMSKFTVGYLQESIMEFMVIIGILVGYMIADGFSILGVIFALFGVVLLPVLPIFYCALFAMLFMSLAKKAHSIKNVNMVSAMCGIFFVLIFVISLLQLEDITAETFIYSLVDGSNMFMVIMQYVFFTVPILCLAISGQNILLFLLFLAVHIAMVVVLYFLASKLYIGGVTAVMSAGKRQSHSTVKSSKQHGAFTANLYRELKTLLRTPTYIINCIIPNVILPLIGLIIIFTGSGGEVSKIVNGLNNPDVLVLFSVIVASCLITAMSGLSSSSFTREGNHADLLKYIPVPYKTQVNVKVVIAVVFSLPAALLGVLLVCISIGCNALLTLACLAGCLMAVMITIYTGVLFDAMHPKLVWEDELSALRGNMSTFLHMAVAIVIGVVLAVLYFFCGNFMFIPVVLAALLVITVILAVYCTKRTECLLDEMIV
ncbi:MAG: hypothetical protein UIM53_02530 [Acutalibacteraceae bacterium]|nr:hypothetical protein [Acutalibacteraceae bacterium]